MHRVWGKLKLPGTNIPRQVGAREYNTENLLCQAEKREKAQRCHRKGLTAYNRIQEGLADRTVVLAERGAGKL